MKIEVFSRADVIKAVEETSEPTLVISINCPGDQAPVFKSNDFVKEVVTLFFDDVEADRVDGYKSYGCTVRPISKADAKRIHLAVDKWKDSISRIIVHCWAGVSRSSGVAAAIGKYLDGDDSFIFDRPRFTPNMTCYRLVLEELMGVPVVGVPRGKSWNEYIKSAAFLYAKTEQEFLDLSFKDKAEFEAWIDERKDFGVI